MYHLHYSVLKEILGIVFPAPVPYILAVFYPFVDDVKFTFHRVQLQSDGLASALLHHWMLGWSSLAFRGSEIGWPLCFEGAERSGEVDLSQPGWDFKKPGFGGGTAEGGSGKIELFSLIFHNLSWSLSILKILG